MKKTISALIVALLTTSTASALQLPFSLPDVPQIAYESKFYGYLNRADIDAAGNLTIQTTFSMGKRWAGDRDVAVAVRFIDDDTKTVYTFVAKDVLPARELGGTKEVYPGGTYNLPLDVWATIDRYEVEFYQAFTSETLARLSSGDRDYNFSKTWTF